MLLASRSKLCVAESADCARWPHALRAYRERSTVQSLLGLQLLHAFLRSRQLRRSRSRFPLKCAALPAAEIAIALLRGRALLQLPGPRQPRLILAFRSAESRHRRRRFA